MADLRYVPRHRNAKVSDWGDAPRRLGMTIDADGALVGLWNGRVPIRAIHRASSSQALVQEPFQTGPTTGPREHYETSYSYATRYEATLDPPLLLAMSAAQVGPALPNRTGFDPARGRDVAAHFAFYAMDRAYALGLLGGPVLDEVLRDADALAAAPPGAPSRGTLNLRIADDMVSVVSAVGDYLVDVDALRAGLEQVGRVAEVLLAQRARAPAPWEPAMRAAWSAVARSWGLSFDPARVSMTGEVRGLGLEVRATIEPHPDTSRRPTHLTTRFKFTFPRPLGCQLSLAKQASDTGVVRGLLNRVFGGQDIVVGDAAFDAAFIVKGEPEALVRAALTPEARQRLLVVRARFDAMSVEDDVLTAWAPEVAVDPAGLDDLLKCTFAAADALGAPRR
jgi:hypothetical protein